MQIRFGKRKKIQFTDRSHPLMGIISVILGGLSLAALIALCAFSGEVGGKAGIFVGVIGMISMAMSSVGFVLAIKCYRKEEIYVVTPTIGSITNGLLIIVYFLLLFMGAL